MQRPIAKELNKFAQEIARRYSCTDREGNVNKEAFYVQDVIPMSDHTAVINFVKSNGKNWFSH